MYYFTNEEYKKLCKAIETKNYTEQLFCLTLAQMRKVEQNNKITKRVNKMRKTNKFYGRSKPKQIKD